MAQTVKNLSEIQETRVPSRGWQDSLEEGMTIHSSICAWTIPWTEEPAGLQCMHGVGPKESEMTEPLTLSIFSCGAQASYIGSFSCCRVQALVC